MWNRPSCTADTTFGDSIKFFTVVDGIITDVNIKMGTSYDTSGSVNTERTHSMGTPKYEYCYNGKKRIHVSNSSSSNIPKIGSIKKLYIDEDGIVVREQGELTFLVFFTILLLLFYLIGVVSLFTMF